MTTVGSELSREVLEDRLTSVTDRHRLFLCRSPLSKPVPGRINNPMLAGPRAWLRQLSSR
jgi:hypothetical protein